MDDKLTPVEAAQILPQHKPADHVSSKHALRAYLAELDRPLSQEELRAVDEKRRKLLAQLDEQRPAVPAETGADHQSNTLASNLLL